jgi:type VI secretion system Hcp family effector
MSKDKPHKGEIDATSWHWGIAQTAKASVGGGTSTADVQDLTIVKFVDSATPKLFSACHSSTQLVGADKPVDGKEVGVVLTLFRNDNGKNLEYMIIKLCGKVIVTSVNTGDAGADDMYTETVTFNFSYAVIGYRKSASDGVAEVTLSIA